MPNDLIALAAQVHPSSYTDSFPLSQPYRPIQSATSSSTFVVISTRRCLLHFRLRHLHFRVCSSRPSMSTTRLVNSRRAILRAPFSLSAVTSSLCDSIRRTGVTSVKALIRASSEKVVYRDKKRKLNA